jgi:arsenate reductase
MAEALVNHDFGDEIEAYSAGVLPTPINKYTIKVMSDLGIDVSRKNPKHVDMFVDSEFDLVITLCDYAASKCPIWHKKIEKVHIPFEDPMNAKGTDDEILSVYRRIRDEIKKNLDGFLRNYLESKSNDFRSE